MDAKRRSALAVLCCLALGPAAQAEEGKPNAVILYPPWGDFDDREQDNVRGSLQSAVAAQGFEVIEDRLVAITLSGDARLQGCMDGEGCRFELAERVNAQLLVAVTLRRGTKLERELEVALFPVDVQRRGASSHGPITARFAPEPNPDIVSLVGQAFADERRRDKARLVVTSTPPKATVLIDGLVAGETELRRAVYVEPHVVKVQAGGRAVEHRLSPQAGRVHQLTADLEQGTITESLIDQAIENPRGYLKWIGVGGLAAGIAALGAGIGLLAIHERPTCGLQGLQCPRLSNTLAGGIALTVGGAVVAAAGGVLIYLGLPKQPKVAVIPALAPDFAGVSAVGRF